MILGPQCTPEIVERDTAAAVRLLARWPGVTRIWLFGSATKGRPLDWRSDLDLAVEGMAATDQGRAWAELDETLTLPADLRGFLNDLRGFRHLFRHSYDFQLDPEKLNRLVRDWTEARLKLLAALTRFRDSLIAQVHTEQ